MPIRRGAARPLVFAALIGGLSSTLWLLLGAPVILAAAAGAGAGAGAAAALDIHNRL